RLQAERLRDVEQGFAPVPLLRARYFADEVLGEPMLECLADDLFGDRSPAELIHSELAREISTRPDGTAVVRIRVPFADRSEISLKKVGAELVVSAGRERRTIILPPALDRRDPA